MHGSNQHIYLDYNATTRISTQVAAVLGQAWRDGYVNAASAHAPGRRTKKRLESARESIGAALGTRLGGTPDRVLFTSGGTESNGLALTGLAGEPGNRLLISSLEHPCVSRTADYLAGCGFDVQRIRAHENGTIDLDHARELLRERPVRLVSVMLANHETGVIQPLRQLGEMCREYGALLHTDAVQGIGKMAVDFSDLPVDALTFTAHKFHGPRGIGGLILRHGLNLRPMLYGGFQQYGWRPGTESIELVLGLEAALLESGDQRTLRTAKWSQQQARLEARLLASVDEAVLWGPPAARLPQTTCIAFPGVDRQALVIALDLAGLACSSGSACASGSSEPSPVLAAMSGNWRLIESSIRLSFGAGTTDDELDRAADLISKQVNNLRPANIS